jgi:septum formation protein
MNQPVILASASESRRRLLTGAGIIAECVRPNVDEDAAKRALRAEGLSIRDQAMRLAELKALKVSGQRAGLVIGADQMLALGEMAFDKPVDLAAARAHLQQLSGKTHVLETAVVICDGGAPVWRHLARPKLTMRPLSEAFIDAYVRRCGDRLLTTVGAYQLEAEGAQLFTQISGDYFSILGLPLLEILDYLRVRGVVAT